DPEARAQAIAAQLRCPVCQNESVADSPSELAAQMRTLIRAKVAAGETDQQIVDYFVSKYGEWILLEPPRRGPLWIVWLAPSVAAISRHFSLMRPCCSGVGRLRTRSGLCWSSSNRRCSVSRSRAASYAPSGRCSVAVVTA